MSVALARLWKPWTWSGRHWLACLVAALIALAAGWGGRHAWAWHHRRAAVQDLARFHPETARQHVNNCLAIWPSDPQALLLASQAARKSGDFAAAAEHLRVLERQTPHDTSVLDLEWSLVRAASGAIDDKTEDFLLPLAQRDPALAPAIWEALIEGYCRVYRIREAFICAERWLEHQPGNVQAHYMRGSINRQIKKLQKAVPDYQKVVELDPTRIEARKWLALGLIESGRYAEALPHLEDLRRQTPTDVNVIVHQARAYRYLGQTQQARRLLDALLAEQPTHSIALRVRGEIELTDRPAEAEKWLRQATQAAPFDYQGQFLLLQALTRQDKKTEVKQQSALVESLKDRVERLGDLMSSKMSKRPRDPALHVEMGSLLISLDQKELGRTWLLSALQNDPDYRPAHAALADYYQQTGDADQAALHRQRAGP